MDHQQTEESPCKEKKTNVPQDTGAEGEKLFV